MNLSSEAVSVARRGEAELSERQREILGLVVRGHTNGEIATATGLSLATVKWHMSEILSKLGFSSRDEAAEYWASRSRPPERFARWVRSWCSLPAMKWTAVTTAALAVGGAGFALWLSGGAAASGNFEDGYHIVIKETATGADGSVRTTVQKVWYADPANYRSEYFNDEGKRTDFEVADGKRRWLFNLYDNAFWDTPLFNLQAGAPPPVHGWAKIGASGAARLDGLMDALPESPPDYAPFDNLQTNRFARVLSHETFRGRAVTLVAYGPTWGDQLGGVVAYRGTARVWVDDETLMLLKFETDSGPEDGRVVRAEVVELTFGRPDDSVFRFDPPASATGRVVLPSVRPPADAIHQLLKRGWYMAPVAPDGFFPWASETNGTPATFSRIDTLLLDESTVPAADEAVVRRIRMIQEDGGRVLSSSDGTPVTLSNGLIAYERPEGHELVLTFSDADVTLTIRGNRVTREELIAFANTLEKRP